ncbi:integrase catalytic domain-containing protein [Trichonephila clavipes]|nr:integrase catalytic domain-containing protein [Trichonephila clavipes]
MAHATPRWTQVLPFVLLGLRSIIKENINASAAELVYGTSIRLSSDFFQDTGTNNVSEFVQQLKQTMHNLKPVPTSFHGRKTVFVHPELSQCTHVFLRHDAIRKPLRQPYDGPFAVVKSSEKLITLQRLGKEICVSIDRVNPAFMLSDTIESNQLSLFLNQKRFLPFKPPALVAECIFHKDTCRQDPCLSDQVGHSYSWATHIIMKGHPTIGKRLSRIKPNDSGTSSPGRSSGSIGLSQEQNEAPTEGEALSPAKLAYALSRP